MSFKLDVAVRAALAKFMRGAWFGGVGIVAVYAACGQRTGGRRSRKRLKKEEDESEEEAEEAKEAEAGRDMTKENLKKSSLKTDKPGKARHRGKRAMLRNPVRCRTAREGEVRKGGPTEPRKRRYTCFVVVEDKYEQRRSKLVCMFVCVLKIVNRRARKRGRRFDNKPAASRQDVKDCEAGAKEGWRLLACI